MDRERNYKMELLTISLQVGWYGGTPLVPLLMGPPGTAKTQVTKQLAAAFREELAKRFDEKVTFPFACLCLPQTMPEELSGVSVPTPDRTEVNRVPLGLLKSVNVPEEEGAPHAMLAFDEVTSANVATRAAAMTGFSDRRFGDITLSPRISIVGMCNPIEQAVNGVPFSPPEANRFVWIKDWYIPSDDTLDYLRGGKGLMAHIKYLPEDWEERFGAHTKGLIASFLGNQGNPHYFNQLRGLEEDGRIARAEGDNPDMDKPFTIEQACDDAWASERSWETLSRLLAAILSIGESLSGELAYQAIIGCIGKGVGNVFSGWLAQMDIPDPEELLSNPDPKRLDGMRPDKLKACLESVAIAAQKKHDNRADRWNDAWKILGPFLSSAQDMALDAANILTREKPKGAKIPEAARQLYHIRRQAGYAS